MNKKIICLMGPTASGKTQLAIYLTQHFPVEIVSVDSAMVYRDMNIGTAKPSVQTLSLVPHALIDIRDPSTPYSAAQFVHDAMDQVRRIIQEGKIPLLVGGTMLYFNALQKGLADMPHANPDIRADIANEALELGWPMLHDKLAKIDPTASEKIHPHDSQRIQRALEVYHCSGTTLTEWQQKTFAASDFDFINLALLPSDRKLLHERIALRFDAMLEEGFLEEVKSLFQRSELTSQLPSIRSVGYRQAWQYLENKLSFNEFKEKAIIATRQLAKRQLTWLRNWKGEIKTFDSESSDVSEQVKNYLLMQIVF